MPHRLPERSLVVLSAFNLIFIAWHIPGLYEWTLRDRLMHNLERVTFLLTALLMRWPVLSPMQPPPRLAWGNQMVYLLALSISQIPVFAYIAFRDGVLYPNRLQATANSVRSCLAPAVCRA